MKFLFKNFFSKSDQIYKKMKKLIMKSLRFCSMINVTKVMQKLDGISKLIQDLNAQKLIRPEKNYHTLLFGNVILQNKRILKD